MHRRQLLIAVPATVAIFALPILAEAATPLPKVIFPDTVLGRAFERVRGWVHAKSDVHVTAFQNGDYLGWLCSFVEKDGAEIVCSVEVAVGDLENLIYEDHRVLETPFNRHEIWEIASRLQTPSLVHDDYLAELAYFSQSKGKMWICGCSYTPSEPPTPGKLRAENIYGVSAKTYKRLVRELVRQRISLCHCHIPSGDCVDAFRRNRPLT